MRIAVGGFYTESSTYNPVLTRIAEFHQLRGQALLQDPYFAFLADFEVDFLPVLHARAIPGGPVEAATYQAFKAEILTGFAENLPLDGVYLAMHGATYVEGMEDAEGDFITAVRALVGPDCLIAASYDLHGNLSQRIIDALDIFASYRTAPHIDEDETNRRAVSMLLRALHTGDRPQTVWVPVPVLLSGERTSTEDEPARSFYGGLAGFEGHGIWDVSFQVGYVWADEPRATAAAVVTGTNAERMAQVAAQIATRYWGHRREFAFGVKTASPQRCLSDALASRTHPVVLADAGDNPTGGGVGDRAEVLAALLLTGASDVIFAGIADAPATDAAYGAGVGAQIRVSIGGTLDPASRAVVVEGLVLFLWQADQHSDRQAVLEIGGIRLVVTARRRPFHALTDFTDLGLDPRTAKIVVVKSGYLSPDIAPIANPALMALTAGAVNQDVPQLENQKRRRPCFPFDANFDWQPKWQGPVVTSA